MINEIVDNEKFLNCFELIVRSEGAIQSLESTANTPQKATSNTQVAASNGHAPQANEAKPKDTQAGQAGTEKKQAGAKKKQAGTKKEQDGTKKEQAAIEDRQDVTEDKKTDFGKVTQQENCINGTSGSLSENGIFRSSTNRSKTKASQPPTPEETSTLSLT